jgi:anti-sigma regulatory factor (Ser/Thr protein kinase)
MHRLCLEETSDPARLAPIRRAVEAFCTSCGFDEKAVGEVGLCVNEALANITRHAYGGAIDQPVRIDASFVQDMLEVTIRDWGNGKDPTLSPHKHDPLTPGGLGMVCLQALMDEMTFQPQPDGMLLTMKRRKGSVQKAVGSSQ